jgi:mono/diheme cytochrome c family protein
MPRGTLRRVGPLPTALLLALLLGLALGCTDDAAPTTGATGSEATVESAVEREASERGQPQPEPQDLEDVAEGYATDLAKQPNEVDWTGGDATSGQTLYVSHCALCHGPGGAGDGPAAVALNPKPRDFRTGTFYIDANANNETGEPVDLARVIREGPGAFGGSDAMVAWKDDLSDDEVRDLVAYIQTLSR